MDRYILGLDLGTTAIKVAIVDLRGSIVAVSTQEYKLLTPDTLSVELPVERYWRAFKDGLADALSKSGVSGTQLLSVGISAQGETLVFLDAEGRELGNAIVWMDNRAQKEAQELNAHFPPSVTCSVTGQVSIVPTWPAAKVLWLRRNRPEIFARVAKVLLLEDWFIHRLTGAFVCEDSLICSTVYWNIRTRTWWPEMLDCIGLRPSQLPEIRRPGELVGKVTAAISEELGVARDLTVCTGVLDQVAGAIGVGNVRPGLFSENTGAALAICATVSKPFVDPALQMPCHCHGTGGLYLAHTFTTGGMALKWFRDAFCELELLTGGRTGLDPYTLLSLEAGSVAPGADGLIMLPHLQGAMAPEANPAAKGCFFGITMKHTRAHFIRALMESIGFIVLRNIEAIESLGIPVKEIRVLGGGSRSDVWNQIKADITGRTVWTTTNSEAASLGAAVVAGVASGVFPGVEEAVGAMVKIKAEFRPDPARHEAYLRAVRGLQGPVFRAVPGLRDVRMRRPTEAVRKTDYGEQKLVTCYSLSNGENQSLHLQKRQCFRLTTEIVPAMIGHVVLVSDSPVACIAGEPEEYT